MAQVQTQQATPQKPVAQTGATQQPNETTQPADMVGATPFWMKWWFWLIVGVGIIGIGVGIYFLFFFNPVA